MPVATEIARAFHAPLDVLVVRKLGVPCQPELAFGAVATGNVQIRNSEITQAWSPSKDLIDAMVVHEREELNRREQLYRGNLRSVDVQGRTVILVDDGIASREPMPDHQVLLARSSARHPL